MKSPDLILEEGRLNAKGNICLVTWARGMSAELGSTPSSADFSRVTEKFMRWYKEIHPGRDPKFFVHNHLIKTLQFAVDRDFKVPTKS